MAGGECRLISGNVQPEQCLRASVQLLIDGVQLDFVTAGSREGITIAAISSKEQPLCLRPTTRQLYTVVYTR